MARKVPIRNAAAPPSKIDRHRRVRQALRAQGGIGGNGLAGFDQILNVEFGGFLNTHKGFLIAASPGMAALEGRAKGVERRSSVFPDIAIDLNGEQIGAHDTNPLPHCAMRADD